MKLILKILGFYMTLTIISMIYAVTIIPTIILQTITPSAISEVLYFEKGEVYANFPWSYFFTYMHFIIAYAGIMY